MGVGTVCDNFVAGGENLGADEDVYDVDDGRRDQMKEDSAGVVVRWSCMDRLSGLYVVGHNGEVAVHHDIVNDSQMEQLHYNRKEDEDYNESAEEEGAHLDESDRQDEGDEFYCHFAEDGTEDRTQVQDEGGGGLEMNVTGVHDKVVDYFLNY